MKQQGRFIFVTGGSRSGKSAFAERLARDLGGGNVAYVATAQVLDEEMERRVAAHRRRRPSEWATFEEPLDLPEVIAKTGARYAVTLVDCITMWVSNLLFREERDILDRARRLAQTATMTSNTVIMVSGEVGWGVIADNPLSRQFCDLLGSTNQILAGAADDAYVTISGISLMLKQGGEFMPWSAR